MFQLASIAMCLIDTSGTTRYREIPTMGGGHTGLARTFESCNELRQIYQARGYFLSSGSDQTSRQEESVLQNKIP